MSESLSTQDSRISMTDLRLCSTNLSSSQANFCHSTLAADFRPAWVYLRTPPLLFRRSPPQWNSPTANVPQKRYFSFALGEAKTGHRVVFQGQDLLSHLSYTIHGLFHLQFGVKVHRVLPSDSGNSASSRRIQFRWVSFGDSGAIVTPFMRDTN